MHAASGTALLATRHSRLLLLRRLWCHHLQVPRLVRMHSNELEDITEAGEPLGGAWRGGGWGGGGGGRAKAVVGAG